MACAAGFMKGSRDATQAAVQKLQSTLAACPACMLKQNGRCIDCGTRMMLGKIVFDHRPPLALRAKSDDANDAPGSRAGYSGWQPIRRAWLA
jgi:hypothetical protein